LGECLLQSVDDEGTAVFGDDVQVEPALAAHQLVAPDVMDESRATRLMKLAVVIEADHRLVPPHVEERVVGAVGDVDLGARP
jgi:hypothetical protein